MLGINSIKNNIIVNFASRAWIGLISLAIIPILIKLLGVEAYGLIGIFTSLTALLAILDLGLSTTLSRELARLSVIPESEQETKNLVRTLQLIYWFIGCLIGIAVIMLAPLIARCWINPQSIPLSTVETTIIIMGLTIAFQWPSSLYTGGLIGLQYQILLNFIKILIGTMQYGGAILVLWFVSPTILVFFYWQLFIAVLNTLLLALCLWKNLPGRGLKAKFSKDILKKNIRFAAGMTGISALATILTQLDKIILSKMLSLEFFGYYMLAYSIAGILAQLSTPISSVLFPVFSQIISAGNLKNLTTLYHKACQLIALAILPITATITFFSQEILSIWLKNPTSAENTHTLLSLLIVGTAINTLVVIPYIIQLAFGMTQLILVQNIFSIIVIIPLMILMINAYGPIGAAIVWIFINASYVFILVPIMHQKILKGELWSWYTTDIALPVSIVFILNFFARSLMPTGQSIYQIGLWIATTYVLSLILLVVCLPASRSKLVSMLNR